MFENTKFAITCAKMRYNMFENTKSRQNLLEVIRENKEVALRRDSVGSSSKSPSSSNTCPIGSYNSETANTA